jgi:hypothetical protein
MFEVLVRTIRSKHQKYLQEPFTVAELHQQILPYRHYRRELGIETNQEYEVTLMQLLSGAKGYLDVDERLRDAFEKELASTSPEPSRVREFSDAQVALNHGAVGSVGSGGTAGSAESKGSVPAAGTAAAAGSPATRPQSSARCRFCGGELPAGREAHFCPHCGQNLLVLNCPACGAEMEPDWKFCVSCGKAIG